MHNNPVHIPRGIFLAALLAGCVSIQPAWSQELIDSTQATKAKPSFLCVAEEVVHDSNVFRLNKAVDPQQRVGSGATRADTVLRTSACADENLYFSEQKLVFLASIDDNRYRNNKMLDYTSGNGTLEWDWQSTRDWHGALGASYQHVLGSFLTDRALEKDLVDSLRYFGEINHDFGTYVGVHVGGSRTETTHDAASRQIDNYRNTAGDAGITWTSRAGNYVGVNYQVANAIYPDDVINNVGIARDYRERIALLRFGYGLGSQTTLSASGGYLSRDYTGSSLVSADNGYDGSVWRASLNWQPRDSTQLELSAWKQLNAYFDSEADHFVSRGASLKPSWSPSDRLKFAALVSWEKQQYLTRSLLVPQATAPQAVVQPTSVRDDKVGMAGLEVLYHPVEWFDLRVSYRYEQHDSTLTAYEFDDQVSALRLRLRF